MSESLELKPLKCPNCGSVDVVYLEDKISVQRVLGLREDGTVEIDPYCNIEDGGSNERFFCHECSHDWTAIAVDIDCDYGE